MLPSVIVLTFLLRLHHQIWHSEIAIRDAATKSFTQTFVTGNGFVLFQYIYIFLMIKQHSNNNSKTTVRKEFEKNLNSLTHSLTHSLLWDFLLGMQEDGAASCFAPPQVDLDGVNAMLLQSSYLVTLC